MRRPTLAYGLTTQPSADEAKRVYYATVVLYCVVAAGMLGYNAQLVPAARDGTNAERIEKRRVETHLLGSAGSAKGFDRRGVRELKPSDDASNRSHRDCSQ